MKEGRCFKETPLGSVRGQYYLLPFGLFKNEYSAGISQQITLDDLFL